MLFQSWEIHAVPHLIEVSKEELERRNLKNCPSMKVPCCYISWGVCKWKFGRGDPRQQLFMFVFPGACFQIDRSCQLNLGTVERTDLRNVRSWSDGNGDVTNNVTDVRQLKENSPNLVTHL